MNPRIDLRPWFWRGSPALIALLLAAPCIRFAFLSDDYNFLQRSSQFRLEQLAPDERSAFYRPVSRELYFGLLNAISPNNPVVAHAANAVMLAITVSLFTALCVRLGGSQFGVVSGLFLAMLGALPFLVGWVSCSQDLLAMAFVVGALLAAVSQRVWVSAFLLGLGLLSKETTLFFVPAVLYLAAGDATARRTRMARAVLFAVFLALWGAVNPTIRAFLRHGASTGQGGYVGLDNPHVSRNAAGMAGTFVNVSPTGLRTPWPEYLTVPVLLALAVLGVLAWVYRRQWHVTRGHDRTVLWTGILTGLVPAVLTVASAKHWFPYYACLPALGTSMLAAYAVQRMRGPYVLGIVALFLFSGVWYRGTDMGKISIPTEANFRRATHRLDRVQRQFRTLHVEFPESAQVYLAIEAPLEYGLHAHLTHSQALRTWYADRSITAAPAEYQTRASWPKYLFWITEGCDVFEIALPSLAVRSGGGQPSYASYQRAIRSYALGAWAAHDVDRAVALLETMKETDRASWEFDRRLSAAILYASGRSEEAGQRLEGLHQLSYEDALGGVAAALTPELPRPGLDAGAFQAFGLSQQDTTAYGELMLYFSDKVLLSKAKRMAEKVLSLDPSDEDARAMIEAIAKVPDWEQVVIPIKGFGNQQAY